MLLKLTFDHDALKNEAKKRGYEAQDFTESIYCKVPRYEEKNCYPVEPWAVSDLSDVEFIYCNESLTVELAIIEGNTLILYHDCDRYPDSPVKVRIKAIHGRDDYTRLSVEKAIRQKDQK